MKREKYHITSTAGHDVIKFAWSSSCREIEKLVGELARAEKATYNLSDSFSEKKTVPFRQFVRGTRTWTRECDGHVVTFTIQKLQTEG